MRWVNGNREPLLPELYRRCIHLLDIPEIQTDVEKKIREAMWDTIQEEGFVEQFQEKMDGLGSPT